MCDPALAQQPQQSRGSVIAREAPRVGFHNSTCCNSELRAKEHSPLSEPTSIGAITTVTNLIIIIRLFPQDYRVIELGLVTQRRTPGSQTRPMRSHLLVIPCHQVARYLCHDASTGVLSSAVAPNSPTGSHA